MMSWIKTGKWIGSIILMLTITGTFARNAGKSVRTIDLDSLIKEKPVPVLCYHNIREWRAIDHKSDLVYIVSPENFRSQMQALHDSGYHAILPDQLIAFYKSGATLPSKPIILTFDDADGSQIEYALPVLNKLGFKGVFFIMTVVLGHNDYMTKEQVKKLSDEGHVIGCHTWNHKMVTKYGAQDWSLQIEKPRAELKEIVGKPINYFSFPYGVWNTRTVDSLKKYGFTAAFKLGGKSDGDDPLFTLKRIIVDGHWDTKQFSKAVKAASRGH